jgi:hypothetical protein
MKLKIVILIVFATFCYKLNAQTIPDSVRYRMQQAYYKQLLNIDMQKARQVAVIQGNYRDSLANLFGRFELDAKGKHKAMLAFDSIRISKLEPLLDPRQLAIIKKAK